MGRNRHKIGKAQKKKKRRKQSYGQSKYGYRTEIRDGYEVYDVELDANLMLATAVTLIMACNKRRPNEKKAREESEET